MPILPEEGGEAARALLAGAGRSGITQDPQVVTERRLGHRLPELAPPALTAVGRHPVDGGPELV